jgi:hypothetical protein
MSGQDVYKIPRSDYLILLPIIALALYLTSIPHHNYPYLVHLDEWIHLACSNQILSQGTATGLVDPFSGGVPIMNQSFELGFHLFWGIFHQISGLSWLDIYKYFPPIICIFTMLAVYILARRQGFGWEATFFAALIPTTVGILGPGFLVPVAMGLFFIPICLSIAFHFRSWWSYPLLFILMAFLLSLHGATAVAVIIFTVPFILLNIKSDLRHSLMTILALVVPFLVLFPWIIQSLIPNVKELFTAKPDVLGAVQVPRIIQTYGYLPVAMALVGAFVLTIRGGKHNYALVLGLLFILVILVIYYTLNYGVGIMYFRGLQFMMLMMAIIAGAGLMGIKNLKLPSTLSARLKIPVVTKNAGYILCLIIIVVTLLIGIPVRQQLPYYHMIDTEDYEAFIWIKENVGNDFERAILDPWKGTAFTAITGKYVYTRISDAAKPSDTEAYLYLQGGCEDSTLLREEGISIVYTTSEVRNPDLVEVRENVYLLK